MLIREASKRLRRLLSFVCFEAVDIPTKYKMMEDIFSKTAQAIRNEQSLGELPKTILTKYNRTEVRKAEETDQKKVIIFQQSMIQFWTDYGRKQLQWRNTNDPWKLLIAEVLLRKTTAEQAAAVYNVLEGFTPQQMLDIPSAALEEIALPAGH